MSYEVGPEPVHRQECQEEAPAVVAVCGLYAPLVAAGVVHGVLVCKGVVAVRGYLEVTCRGPAESALQCASLYGVEVLGYVNSDGGLVSLFVPSEYEYDVLRWYGSSSDVRAPGAVVSVVSCPALGQERVLV